MRWPRCGVPVAATNYALVILGPLLPKIAEALIDTLAQTA